MRTKDKWLESLMVLTAFVTLACLPPAAGEAAQGPLKVFILAGQSNMEGHAVANTLDYLGEDPEHGALLKKIKKEDGSWVVRKDVWIWYLGRKGDLELGYGAGSGEKSAFGINLGKMFGPELAFGIVMGDHFENQVLLIKTAWGGKSIYRDFRPPSSNGEVGPFYTEMLEHVKDVLKNLKTHFPAYDEAKGYEVCGFLWFQGWNDMCNNQAVPEYEENLANLVKDLRKELDLPKLPVVIGELGVNGPEAKGNMLAIRKAQAAVAERPELKGTVRFVKTSPYYDMVAHKMCQEGVWKTEERGKFYRIASERPFHYLGSGKMMFQMGHAFGEGMIELLKK